MVIGNAITEKLKAGATYSFVAMAKTSGVTTGGAVIKIDILNGSATLGQKQSEALIGDKEWTKLSVSISTGEIRSQPDYA